MKRCGVYLFLLAFFSVLVACGERPLPAPEQPQATPTSAGQYTYYWPVLMRAWEPMPAHTKRGIGLIYGIMPEPNYTADSVAAAGGAWWHNWSMWPARGQSVAQNGATFVPTLWGYGEPEYVALAEMCGRGFTGPLMWLNEPDQRGQANKTPAQAVAILERILDICPGVQLVGPRLSHEDWTQRFPWVKEFWGLWRDKYGKLPPTIPAFHGYFPGSTWEVYLRDYAALLAAEGWPDDTQAWIPEWNIPCPPGRLPEQQAPLVADVAALLDASPLVEYHSPFGLYLGRGYWPNLECAELRDEQGRLTAVGEIYSGAGNSAQAAYP